MVDWPRHNKTSVLTGVQLGNETGDDQSRRDEEGDKGKWQQLKLRLKIELDARSPWKPYVPVETKRVNE